MDKIEVKSLLSIRGSGKIRNTPKGVDVLNPVEQCWRLLPSTGRSLAEVGRRNLVVDPEMPGRGKVPLRQCACVVESPPLP